MFIALPTLQIAICSYGNRIPLWCIIALTMKWNSLIDFNSDCILDLLKMFIDTLTCHSFTWSQFLLFKVNVSPFIYLIKDATRVRFLSCPDGEHICHHCRRNLLPVFCVELFRGHCSTMKFWSSGRSIQLAQINDEFRPQVPALGANDTLVPLCGQSVHKQMYSSE